MRLGRGQARGRSEHRLDDTPCLLPQLAKPRASTQRRTALLQLCDQCQQHQADVAGLVQSQDPRL